MKKSVLADLSTLCVDIYAHAEIDSEITLCGNGTSACEATNVANRIFEILGIDKNTDLHQMRIEARVKELEKEYGLNDE